MPTQKNVELPDIGDFDSVDVIEVLVKVGDTVNENDSLITLETDKATMEIPAPFPGKVASLKVKVGDKIAKGELILTIESDSEPEEEASNKTAAPSNSEATGSSNNQSNTSQKNVELPDIGDFDSVDVIEVLVKVGDTVNENDSLITLETDKATMEIPAPFPGKVASLKVKVGDKIAKGELILTIESDSEPEEDTANKTAAPSNSDAIEGSNIDIEAPKKEATKKEITLTTESNSHASPSIRKLARDRAKKASIHNKKLRDCRMI